MKKRIFISSVQKEFASERQALKTYILGDALLSRFFDVFLFEDLPASDRRPDDVYLDEVRRCGVYLGLFGDEYGWEDAEGYSPTHREFLAATKFGIPRLVFVKGTDDRARHPKVRELIGEAGVQLIRRRFSNPAEMIAVVYAGLVQHLESVQLIRTGPWDSTCCQKAGLTDIDEERISRFVRDARNARGFPLSDNASPVEILTHLNLLDDGRPSHAAILLFGRQPQRFIISSEVKCAHFHGAEVAKPIPSLQVYKGTVFTLVDQALDFVMSKLNLSVGTRKDGPRAPVAYEIPREVVAEAIVNAVAHRDYTSNGSIQVMLFSDRLEVWNPGVLPHSLTLEKLRHPHGSIPANPLLAEPLYLTEYIERMGTGTRDMIRRCREAGLPEPEFAVSDGFLVTLRRPTTQITGQVAGQVTGQVAGQVGFVPLSEPERVLFVMDVEMTRQAIQKALQLRGRDNFENRYLKPALEAGLIERTLPDKPTSRLQKYRLTPKGHELLTALKEKGSGA